MEQLIVFHPEKKKKRSGTGLIRRLFRAISLKINELKLVIIFIPLVVFINFMVLSLINQPVNLQKQSSVSGFSQDALFTRAVRAVEVIAGSKLRNF